MVPGGAGGEAGVKRAEVGIGAEELSAGGVGVVEERRAAEAGDAAEWVGDRGGEVVDGWVVAGGARAEILAGNSVGVRGDAKADRFVALVAEFDDGLRERLELDVVAPAGGVGAAAVGGGIAGGAAEESGQALGCADGWIDAGGKGVGEGSGVGAAVIIGRNDVGALAESGLLTSEKSAPRRP